MTEYERQLARIRHDLEGLKQIDQLEALAQYVALALAKPAPFEPIARPKMSYVSDVELLHETEGSAGLDLRLDLDCDEILLSGGKWTRDIERPTSDWGTTHRRDWNDEPLGTGVRVAIPPGHFGMLVPRSSLRKRGIEMGTGIIDSDYRGEIKMIFFTPHVDGVRLSNGERVAQLIIIPYTAVQLERGVALDETRRGTGGMGSTGTT